jgi:hypothetical protein
MVHIPRLVQAKKNLRIMTVNCRSIRDKQQEFKTALHYLRPDVVCEPWLKEVKPDVVCEPWLKGVVKC